jgi:hypothetical protein
VFPLPYSDRRSVKQTPTMIEQQIELIGFIGIFVASVIAIIREILKH